MISAERQKELRDVRTMLEKLRGQELPRYAADLLITLIANELSELRAQGLSQEDRAVPRTLIERAMESCQVNNDHDAWNALLWVLDPASFSDERLDCVQNFLRRLGGQTT